MAYGNWGGYVYKDGKRQIDWEDATPFHENDVQSGYYQAFMRDREVDGVKLDPHHSVLGDDTVRLCGYKNWPVLFVDGVKVDIKEYGTTPDPDYPDDFVDWEGEVNGHKFSAYSSDNSVILRLEQSDGSTWRAECGYMMGNAGEDSHF